MDDPVATLDQGALGALLVALPSTGVFRLVGPDARRFCNGMFTNNARDLPVGGGQRSAMCDAKGRLLGLLDLYCAADEDFVVVLEGVPPEDFAARYARYIVFDDVEMDDRTEAMTVFTLQGPKAAAILAAAGLPVPADGWAEQGGLGVARRDRSGRGGFDLLVPRVQADATRGAVLEAGAHEAGFQHLEVLRVEAGMPRWPVDMPGRALIHELGLRDVVCSFEKGCYVGQEVINRLDVMGRVRKELAVLRLLGDPPDEPLEVRVEGAKVGAITSLARSPRLGWVGLAILRKPHDAPGARVLVGEQEVPAEVLAGEGGLGG